MHWRITLKAVDPTGDEYRKGFRVEKDLDDLAAVKWSNWHRCSIRTGLS